MCALLGRLGLLDVWLAGARGCLGREDFEYEDVVGEEGACDCLWGTDRREEERRDDSGSWVLEVVVIVVVGGDLEDEGMVVVSAYPLSVRTILIAPGLSFSFVFGGPVCRGWKAGEGRDVSTE